MHYRSAARPHLCTALLCALLLPVACDDDSDGDTDGAETGGDTDPAGSMSTTDPTSATASTTDPTSDPTDPTGSSTDPTTGPTTSDDTTGSTGGDSSTGGDDSSGSDGTSSTGEAGLTLDDIVGMYTEPDGAGGLFPHEITLQSWTIDFPGFTSVVTFEQIDDDAQWIAGEENDGGTYTRYDWAIDGDDNLRYCAATFAEETLQEAIDAPPSDRDDFDGTGCGGAFPWSLLSPAR